MYFKLIIGYGKLVLSIVERCLMYRVPLIDDFGNGNGH